METEARESADCVRRQVHTLRASITNLAASLRDNPPAFVTTCARGSSDHAALFGKYLIERALGLPVASAAPSVASVYGIALSLEDALTVAISQSGKSPDIVRYTQMAREGGARTLAIVNTPASPLADATQWTLALSAGPERSVAATKSFICTLAALTQLVGDIAQSRELADATAELPDVLSRAAAVDYSALQSFLAEEQGCFVVGRGLGYAIAQEAALKLKETCGILAEAISAAEVQHGPMTLLAQGVPVLFLIHGDRTAKDQIELAHHFAAQGARVFVAAPARYAPDLPLAEGASPVATAVGMIQTFYLMAASLSVSRGNDPDNPPLLNKVTETH